jgi:alkylation response protein AidB-like acyl-CoA dehydrogenase
LTRLEDALRGEHEELRASARRAIAGDLGALGFYGLTIPERHGGAGLGQIEACVVAEELGRALAGAPFLGAAMAAAALEDGAALRAIAAGARTASLVWDPAWALDADLLVGAREGAARTPIATLDETRPMVAVEGPIDEPPARAMDVGRVVLAAEQLGVADRCLELAVEHAKTRVQFGRPIGSFQAVKHLLAEMLARNEGARSASRWAAWACDHAPEELPVAAAVARATCTEAALRASGDALQVFGGIGFTWEHPIHRYLKRARAQAALLGPVTASRDVVARHLGI